MEPKIIEAFHPRLGRNLHVNDALNGLACGCICTSCGSQLEAVQGKDREWHYRHHTDGVCVSAPMTELHRKAIGMILQHYVIKVNGETVWYLNASSSGRAGKYLPDVSAQYRGELLLIEVKVTHGCEEGKINFYTLSRYRSFEIDLSGLDPAIGDEDLHYELFENPDNKHTIYWPLTQAEIDSPRGLSWAWIVAGILLLIGLIWSLCQYAKGKARRRKRVYSFLKMPKKSYGI